MKLIKDSDKDIILIFKEKKFNDMHVIIFAIIYISFSLANII